MISVFRPRFCTVRLYWAGNNLGESDEFCYDSCPWRRIDRSHCWPVVQHATTVPRMPPDSCIALTNTSHLVADMPSILQQKPLGKQYSSGISIIICILFSLLEIAMLDKNRKSNVCLLVHALQTYFLQGKII